MVYICICFALKVLFDSLTETLPVTTSVGREGGGGRGEGEAEHIRQLFIF